MGILVLAIGALFEYFGDKAMNHAIWAKGGVRWALCAALLLTCYSFTVTWTYKDLGKSLAIYVFFFFLIIVSMDIRSRPITWHGPAALLLVLAGTSIYYLSFTE